MPIITQTDLLSSRRTKIVATLGPSSKDPETIKQLITAGVDVFRLNLSHGTHDDHRAAYERVRSLSVQLNKPVAVLADLCGPKIRTGQFRSSPIELKKGDTVTVTTRDVLGEPGLIPSQYKAMIRDVRPGNSIFLDDGKILLRTESTDGQDAICTVIQGGLLHDNKGINLPGVDVSAQSFTEKDRIDAKFAMELGIDFLALSFVRSGADILDLRALIHECGHDVPIVAKIEKAEALKHSTEILEAADAIMVARGDLGVELSPEEVPIAQQKLIEKAVSFNKPVIVATQMLESMTNSRRPSRAEVTDVSFAVTGGVDAVMLSAETSVGAYPTEAVEMMVRIILLTESFMWKQRPVVVLRKNANQHRPVAFGDAVANATAQLSYDLLVKAILIITRSGMSAATISSARPAAPVIAVAPTERIRRRMNLYWGVIPAVAEDVGSVNPNVLARRVALRTGLAKKGDYVLLVRGFNSDPALNTPTITLLAI